jgi:zinc protease
MIHSISFPLFPFFPFFPPMWTTDVTKEILPNGLTLLVRRDDSAPVVAVVTHVRAGYFDEPDHWVGIAHVLEHMFFKGTARRGPGDIARDTQLLGGYLNAGTIYDKTVYYTVLPSTGDGLERALDVQADALMNTALDPQELARELEVIIQEAKRKLDTPPAVARETLYELLFTKHRMRRWRIGTEEGLRKLTADDLTSYYRTRYTPGRTIVGIVGDMDVDRAVELATATYSPWDRPAAEFAGSPAEPDGIRPDVTVIHGDVARPIAGIGWRTVGALHADAAALDVAASVLGAGRGSSLYRGLRVPGLASSAHASHYTPTEVGVFEVGLETDETRLDDSVIRVSELISELIERVAAEDELERSRALIKARWSRGFESMDGRAAALCEAEALGEYGLLDELYNRTLAVTPDDVRRVAGLYLNPEHACAVFYLPEGGESRTAEQWPLVASSTQTQLPSVSLPQPRNREPPGDRHEETVEYAGGIRRATLPGIDLLVREKRGAGLVSLAVHVPGVTGSEAVTNAGITQLMVRSTVRGAGALSGEQLAQAAELLGGGVVPNNSADGVGWSMTVRCEALRDAARLLRLVALEPTLTDEAVAVERKLQASDARRQRDDMYGYPVQRVLGEAYAGDPYGLPLLGEPEIVESMTGAQVREWHGTLGSRRAAVVAVGDLATEELIDSLEPLSWWPATPRSLSEMAELAPFKPAEDCETRDKAQSALAMAFPAFPYNSPDRYALTVAGALLSGLAGRLFHELRDKRSLAYTVAAMPWLRKRAGAMIGYVATSPEREGEARDTMLRELYSLSRDEITTDELDRARNYAAGMAEVRQQSGGAVAGEIMAAWLHGTLEELPEVPARLRAVTAEDVARVARDVFQPDQRAEFVIRGTGKSK